MSEVSEANVWMFNFGLERQDGAPVERTEAEALLDHIVAWAEARGHQIGGGYSEPTEDEAKVNPDG